MTVRGGSTVNVSSMTINRADKMTGYQKYKVNISYIMQQLDLPLRSKGTLKHETVLLLLSPFSTGVN